MAPSPIRILLLRNPQSGYIKPSCRREARKDRVHRDDDIYVVAIDEPEHGEQSIYIITAYGSEKTSLQATEEQSHHPPLTKKELALKPKRHEYCRTAALHVEEPTAKFSIDIREVIVR